MNNCLPVDLPERLTFNTEELYHPDMIVCRLCSLLDERKQGFLAEPAGYSLKELIANAVKANLKRAHFINSNLDINNPEEYQKGMSAFKTEYLDNHGKKVLEKTCRLNRMTIAIDFKYGNDALIVSVENNGVMTPEERERTEKRIQIAVGPIDPERIMSEISDGSEGAGLGIVLAIKLLGKNGIPGKPIQYSDLPGVTRVDMIIPDWITPGELTTELAGDIAEKISYLPPLPVNLSSLSVILSSENCNFSSIEKYLKTDPGLSADILRCANSPLYMNIQKITNLETAAKTIGFKGIQRILYFSGALGIMEKQVPPEEIRKYSMHSFQVAVIAASIVRLLKLGIDETEAYTAGLLHDLGTLMLLTMPESRSEQIRRMVDPADNPESVLDALANGYEHDIVGSRLAQFWNFPRALIQAIRFHHHPGDSPEENSTLVKTIYMADRITDVLESRSGPGEINPEVARALGIIRPDQLDSIMEACRKIAGKTLVVFHV